MITARQFSLLYGVPYDKVLFSSKVIFPEQKTATGKEPLRRVTTRFTASMEAKLAHYFGFECLCKNTDGVNGTDGANACADEFYGEECTGYIDPVPECLEEAEA